MDEWVQGMDGVFQHLEPIRERIMRSDAPIGLPTARQAYSTWLLDLPRQLWRLQPTPFRGVNLNAENSQDASANVQRAHQRTVYKLVTIVLRSSNEIANFTPSHCLKIHREIFSDENCESFADFETCRNRNTAGLAGMSMIIPNSGRSLNFIFGNTLSSPEMRELRILFFDEASRGRNVRVVPFLQMILNGATGLETLLFLNCKNSAIPATLECSTFPASLKSLYLECELTSQQLQPLTDCNLPNLCHFGVTISGHTFEYNLLFRVLDRFKATLQRLYFHGIKYNQSCIPRVGHVSYFRFPVMESLKLFVNTSIHGELANEYTPLQRDVPQLKHVWLKNQTKQMFNKWTENSCFPTVTSLGVGLVKDTVPVESFDHDISVGETEMLLVHSAFPNVTVLHINVAGDLGGLICLFQGALPLTELKLVVKKNGLPSYDDYWDCLLIGVSCQQGMQSLVANPELVNNPNYIPTLPCIRRFPALRFLALSASFLPALEKQDSLISDDVFTLAFLRMPNLNRLDLAGMFKASPRATELWESQGRTINYTDSEDAYGNY